MAKKKSTKRTSIKKTVATINHTDDKRTNIPTAELEPVVSQEQKAPLKLRYPRNPDLDPQLVWRGKDEQDQRDLEVDAPPLYIQEKVHPKVLIDDLLRQTKQQEDRDDRAGAGLQLDLFGDFNGLPDEARSTEFYQHEANWTNRMILGDSLQVMASLAEREGLRGKVQCIYIDPPYGIKFNSNFQWSTTSRDVKDGKSDHITREPEQVKAFRDTWRDGIHSYLTYLRDRLTVARDLLSESGSIFVQIGDENVHRIRAMMDEIFGEENHVNTIVFKKKSATFITESVFDEIVWYCKSRESLKLRSLFEERASPDEETKFNTLVMEPMVFHNVGRASDEEIEHLEQQGARWARVNYPIVSQHPSDTRSGNYEFRGKSKICGANKQWRFSLEEGLPRIEKAGRIFDGGGKSLGGVVFWDDWNQVAISNIWSDIHGEKFPVYVVQTATSAVQRCILMTTDPGDLVIDPTCGSGTTAFVAELWGRRWITMDTSRVALALARTRIMGAKYPFFLLSDSQEGQQKEAALTRTEAKNTATHSNIRHGFVYERVPRVKLKAIANNAEIDVIWEQFQEKLEPLREDLNKALKQKWEEWEIPREAEEDWSDKAQKLHADWWKLRIERQKEIDASIAAKADFEYLYDRPYEDKSKVRVAGPFTVESLSPHRILGVDENDELFDPADKLVEQIDHRGTNDFVAMVLESLKVAGVQQSAKEDRIKFSSLTGWPGELICAQGTYTEGDSDDAVEKMAGIFIGPEFGTVGRIDLVRAVRECADAGFDVLVACAFNFEAHTTEFNRLGSIPVLKARMNADLHMGQDLKNTGKGNLFVIFGEPDIDIVDCDHGQIQVKVNGVDVFDPSTGEVRSDNTDGIACWFIDTDYNEESFFVRHAYFLGAGDPYKSLKSTLKAEINQEAWETLYSDTSRPFARPPRGRIAVKVINHLGDEVMKVFNVNT